MQKQRKAMMIPLVLLLASCTPQREVAAPAAAATVATRRGDGVPRSRAGELKVPDRLRFTSVGYVREADSWDARLETMTSSERARLEALNARYFGMLGFDSAEEQRKLAEAGFPMPEEWLAADAMSDEALATLAKANSPKGSIFYANRELDRFHEAKQQMIDAGQYRELDRSVMRPKVEAMVYAANALALTRSPFAAYLYGSVYEQLFGDPAYTAAAISVAGALGDKRAGDLAHEFAEGIRARHAKPYEFESMAIIESMMWRDVHRYRPL